MGEITGYQGWTSGSQTRGTLDVLWTSLSTLALCVWTAVHPNITLSPSTSRNLLHRVGMMVLAIIFPELIISAAWRQLSVAQKLCSKTRKLRIDSRNREIRSRFPKHCPENYEILSGLDADSTRDSNMSQETSHDNRDLESRIESITAPWTTEQAFFALMGGFTVQTECTDEINGIHTVRRIITPAGIIVLAEVGLLPTVAPEDIEERSNADIIAKVVVLSQIIWFALQVIGRLISRLPVTLLEAHTAVHVGCTIIVYLIWFKKPYNLSRSVLLEGDGIRDMASLFNFADLLWDVYLWQVGKYEIEREAYWKDRVVRASNNIIDHDPPPNPPVAKHVGTVLERCLADELQGVPVNAGWGVLLKALAPSAHRGLQRLNKYGFDDLQSITGQRRGFLRTSSENFTIRAVWGSWSTNTGHEMSLEKAIHFLFNFLYGGGHLAAWASSSFPTLVESWLWRGAAIMLCAVPVWGCLWILWWKAVGSRHWALAMFRDGDLDIIAAPFFFLVMLAYTVARCYFLVESLVSLRRLPKEAYTAVDWTNVLPHFS